MSEFLDFFGDSDGNGIPDIITTGPHTTQFFDVGVRQVFPLTNSAPGAFPKMSLSKGFVRGRYDVLQANAQDNDNLKAPDITDEGDLTPAESVGGGYVLELPHYSKQIQNQSDFFTQESGLVETVYTQFLGFPRFRWETQLESDDLYQDGEELDEQDFIVNVKDSIEKAAPFLKRIDGFIYKHWKMPFFFYFMILKKYY